MPTITRPRPDCTPEQLRFPPSSGFTVRADFSGGDVSSDLGVLLLGAVDRRIGLIDRLTAAISDSRDARYITHPLRDLLLQRVFQIASGYEDGNDSNSLRIDPLFKLAAGRAPLGGDNALASGPTFSRMEGSLRRRDIYRMSQALVEQFIAGYAQAPASITLDLDHTDDATYGQQELAFYNHHYGHYCYLPLLIFEANSGALVTAVLRPSTRPTGAENAMIMKRVLGLLRKHWPQTHILVRGDSHFSTPELMQLISADGHADFIFGMGRNPLLTRKAEGLMRNARGLFDLHQTLAKTGIRPPVPGVRLFGDFDYRARSWAQAHRVVLKAEVLPGNGEQPAKDNARFVVTSLYGPSARTLYEQDYCARGQAENLIKQLKGDLSADRTSASTFTANFGRLLLSAAAYVLHQQLRQIGLQGTPLAVAQPKTVILSLFKIAAKVKQYKDRILLQLPTSCPVKELLAQVCRRLYPTTRVRMVPTSP
ncbi:IS1380 family transposase [Paludibacterium sp.]|uniref:IS1380 family transposase n=1 Tax=Paludibacterium sp. TaxID=1917523 RepID=UPI0025EC3A88|nr:IS1380 family transposase [Paludibacterium sp.]MBV8647719.1 IS1380 family transposase [Paludibacterium sp.]